MFDETELLTWVVTGFQISNCLLVKTAGQLNHYLL